MRDRLTELILSADIPLFGTDRPYAELYAEYLLENGVIVPPCKVGDKVYYIPLGKTVTECFVHAVEYQENAIVIKCHMWDKERVGLLHKHLVYFNDNDFGKTVFLTKEEAKKHSERTKMSLAKRGGERRCIK
jgi:hypothetical protein